MSSELAILRVGFDGRIRSATSEALRLLGSSIGQACFSVVCAQKPDGGTPCQEGCTQRLLESRVEPNHAVGVTIRGQRYRLYCNQVGEEVIVVLHPSAGVVGEISQLTNREIEVLDCTARGLNSRTAGEELGISPATVRTHAERARKKLNAVTRAQAVAHAINLGLIS